MDLQAVGRLARSAAPATLLLLLATALLAPQAFGFSGGITKDTAPDANAFAGEGCTACHGDHNFAVGGLESVAWTITDADGNALAGNAYEHDAEYTISIALNEQNAPEAANRAGFNLRASAGTLVGVDGSSQATGDGAEATHVNAGAASWTVMWTAPAEGPVVFDLFVNDVDGSGAPDATDWVYRVGFWLTDDHHAVPGAVEEHEVHFGISLQQYWLGLIAIAAAGFVMVFGFFYLKYASPHNTDSKDR